jgi:hypothetical protein
MNTSIWKFEFEVDDEFTIEMPKGARILHVDTQHEKPCIWALVVVESPKVNRRFAVRGTGHPCDDLNLYRAPDERSVFVGTFMMAGGVFVFHLFDRGEK